MDITSHKLNKIHKKKVVSWAVKMSMKLATLCVIMLIIPAATIKTLIIMRSFYLCIFAVFSGSSLFTRIIH